MRTQNRLTLLLILALASMGCHRNQQQVVNLPASYDFDSCIGVWYDYSTVDWALLDTLYYRPYEGDWPDAYASQVGEGHIATTDCAVWNQLQNARTKFHQDNLALRTMCDESTCAALDAVEAAFDTVFVHYMQEDYYLRSFIDVYQEVLPPTIDKVKIPARK